MSTPLLESSVYAELVCPKQQGMISSSHWCQKTKVTFQPGFQQPSLSKSVRGVSCSLLFEQLLLPCTMQMELYLSKTQGCCFLLNVPLTMTLWGQGTAPQAEQNQRDHSPGYHQANWVHPSDEIMGHSSYCQRPRPHSAYKNIVWKTIETRVQVFKAPEDERISYRFQSSDLCLTEPIPRLFSCLSLIVSLCGAEVSH